MAARIYADTPGNSCSCGGKFTLRVPHSDNPNITVPRCSSCKQYPPLFLIDADGIGLNGEPKRVKIRDTQNGERLDRIGRVIYTIERIVEEIKDGSFDIRKYASKKTRDAFIFANFAKFYQELQDARLKKGELTKKGHMSKSGLLRRELLPFFGSIDMAKINAPMINKFKDSYLEKNKDRTRDQALSELKTILREANRQGLLVVVPQFDKINRSSIRRDIISLELAKKTISLMDKQRSRDMYTLMTIYPMRPCEIRALMWKHIDFEQRTITIDQHFSDETLTPGRKSVKKGEASSLKWNLNDEAFEILQRLRKELKVISLDWKNSYIFTSKGTKHVSDELLRSAWTRAREKAGHNFQAYECRHAVSTALYKKMKGDMVKFIKVAGWTNANTPTERYLRVDTDMDDIF